MPGVVFAGGRLALGQAFIAAGRPDSAVEHLLVCMKLNKADGIAKDTLLKVFEALGPAHPVVAAGRKALAKVLFM
jgi:putative thioredoxin